MQPYNLNPGPEALRWLGIAEKLLQTRDLVGSKTFATRARESDPRLEHADQILAIADTLIAGEEQISNNHLDWYAILQLPRRTHDSELIASQYRRLALLLNPNRNKFPFAEHAFKLVSEAWLVLSNPSRKFQFDNEFGNSSNNSHFNFIHEPQQQLNNSTHFNFIQEHSEQLHQSAPLQQQFLPPFTQQQLFPQQQPPQTFNLQQQHHMQPPLPQQQSRSNQSQQPLPRPQPQQPFPRLQPQPQPPLPLLQPQSQQPSPRPQPQKLSPQPQPQKPSPQPQPQKPSPQQPQPQPEQSLPLHQELGEDNNDDNADNDVNVEESSSFWTACPYCYNMYEYLRAYADCTLRCQNCKRAFHAVRIAAPPPTLEGKDAYFCCWGFYPLGVSTSYLEKNKKDWKPFSTMFAFPQGESNVNVWKRKNVRKNSGPWIYIDDDEEIFVELSSSDDSDDDWGSTRKKKKARRARRKSWATKSVQQPQVDKTKKAKGANSGNSQGGVVAQEQVDVGVPNVAVPNVPVVETGKKTVVATIRKQPGRVAKDLGKLDLNVEFSNEVEEPAPGTSGGNKAGNGVEDNIEGIGFFEGLDEFLSSLPILNVVGDDKVKAG